MARTFIVLFYVDDGYIVSRDPAFLQTCLDILVRIFERVGLFTNVKKTKAMTCLIIIFLFLLTALTAELRRPSSRRRESNSRPFTKQEGITVTNPSCLFTKYGTWSSAFKLSAVTSTISKPPNSLRAVPQPRVPDTSARVR